jgi:hypothetical protein
MDRNSAWVRVRLSHLLVSQAPGTKLTVDAVKVGDEQHQTLCMGLVAELIRYMIDMGHVRLRRQEAAHDEATAPLRGEVVLQPLP